MAKRLHLRSRKQTNRTRLLESKIKPTRQGRVPSISSQLRAHFRRLVRRPHGLTGIGIGYRRRKGRVIAEPVIRLVVREKIHRASKTKARLPKGIRALPKSLPIVTTALGQRVVIQVPTDIEQMPGFSFTHFRIGSGSAASYAIWTDGGIRQLGIVTASHVLPVGSTNVGVEIDAPPTAAGPATIRGTVVVRSDVAKDGIDVALVQIDKTEMRLFDAGPDIAPLASQSELEKLLGGVDDGREVPAFLWTSGSPACTATAFYAELEVPLTGGGTRHLIDAVECSGPPGTFTKGISGSAWAGQAPEGEYLILGIQSLGAEPGFARALGTAFFKARDWIVAQTGFRDLSLAWNRREVAALLASSPARPT